MVSSSSHTYFSEIVEEADSYLWDFGDGNMSTDRDPTHSYTDPGIYEVQLVATEEDCKNESIIKEVEILTCRRDIFDDSNFAFFNISPNPSNGTFKVVVELLLETDVLIELYTINGVLLSSDSYQDKLLSKDYVLTDGGIYFVKVKTPFFSKAKKVFVHK